MFLFLACRNWNTLATVHLTEISADSRSHYHKKMTEIYTVLEGEGYLELDGEKIPGITRVADDIQELFVAPDIVLKRRDIEIADENHMARSVAA